MFNFKPVLAATIIALAVPLAATSPSLAQGTQGTKAQGFSGGGGHGGGGHIGRGGGGGGHISRGGGFGGGGRHMAGGGWHGGGHHGGWRGGHHHRHSGGFYTGFYPGFGFGVGSAFASPYYYDDSYGYYDDSPTVEVVPSSGDDVAYCQQRFKSYDVSSGTYLGYDGKRHPCP
ncbi:conserved hypothetical protein [Nitrobacter hamburgensis X14]|uniref:Lectin-like protein BA14k n=1 Tax=Nitrobacter hamburgensis (strain DSM 10229 / NCIMB 13809 / X14) TaxID=323097 RepID=Q1QLL8_NITHX|nr:BA14K family protein [Nitrobacter hamburgensis]ABE62879.1 conserved hypothetical protein [Nitrobacter hamburgensis X14]